MVHHVTVEYVLPREIEKTAAERDAAAVRHDHRVQPDGLVDRLAIDLRQLERVDVDVEDVVVVLVLVGDRPLLDRVQIDLLIDPIVIEELVVDEEGELAPVTGRVDLRRQPGEGQLHGCP